MSLFVLYLAAINAAAWLAFAWDKRAARRDEPERTLIWLALLGAAPRRLGRPAAPAPQDAEGTVPDGPAGGGDVGGVCG